MNNELFNTLTKVAAEAIPVTVAPSVNPGVVKSLVEAGKSNGEVIPQVTGKGTIGNEEAGVAKTAEQLFEDLVKIAAEEKEKKGNPTAVGAIGGTLAGATAGSLLGGEVGDEVGARLTNKMPKDIAEAFGTNQSDWEGPVRTSGKKAGRVGGGILGAAAGLGAGAVAGKAIEKLKDKKQEKTASEQSPQELLQAIKQKEIEYSKAKEDYERNIINGQINGAFRGGVGGGILGATAGAIDPKVVHGKSRPAAALLAGLGTAGLGSVGGASIGGIKAALARNQFGISDKRRAITEAEDQLYNAVAEKNAHEELFDTLTKTAKVNFGQTIKNVATSAKDKLKMPDIKKPEVKAAVGGAAVGTAAGAGIGAMAANASNKKEEKLASEDSMSGLFKEAAHVILESPFPEAKTIIDPITKIKF